MSFLSSFMLFFHSIFSTSHSNLQLLCWAFWWTLFSPTGIFWSKFLNVDICPLFSYILTPSLSTRPLFFTGFPCLLPFSCVNSQFLFIFVPPLFFQALASSLFRIVCVWELKLMEFGHWNHYSSSREGRFFPILNFE